VAGTDWMAWVDKLGEASPIDCVEGIGGFLLDVLGLWTFDMVNVFGQMVKVTACIVEGCTSEFRLGVDFLREHQATMDFAKNEVRYDKSGKMVVIPFRTFDAGGQGKVAPVRLVRRSRIARSTVTPVEIAVRKGYSSLVRTMVRCCWPQLSPRCETGRLGCQLSMQGEAA
jgi:hypothetical protein